jgi:hypothetical protein
MSVYELMENNHCNCDHEWLVNILDKTYDLWDKERFGRRLRKREIPTHIDVLVTQRDTFQPRKPFEVHASNLDELTWRRKGKELPIVPEERRRPTTAIVEGKAHPPPLEDASHIHHFHRSSNHTSGLEVSESKKLKEDSRVLSKTGHPPSPPTVAAAHHRPSSAASCRPRGVMMTMGKEEGGEKDAPRPRAFQSRMRRKDPSIVPKRPKSAAAEIKRRAYLAHLDVTGKVTQIRVSRSLITCNSSIVSSYLILFLVTLFFTCVCVCFCIA